MAGGYGILGLISNYVGARHQRQQQKEQEAWLRYLQARANILSPDPEKFQANSIDDAHDALEDIIGPQYKEHKPFIHNLLHGIGNTVMGTMSGEMPGARVWRIPTAVDPQTGLAIRLMRQGSQPATGQQGQPGLDQLIPGVMGVTPRMLVQAQQGGQGGQALPTAPPSTIAPGGPKDATPVSLATGNRQILLNGGGTIGINDVPQTPQQKRAQQIARGGRPVNPKDPNSPIRMPLPQDVLDTGTANYLTMMGKFGKIPQEIQEATTFYQNEVAAGHMTRDQAIEGIKKVTDAYLGGGGTTAAGTNEERHLEIPAHKDAQGNDVPAETRVVYQNKNTLAIRDATTGETYPQDKIKALNARIVDKPTASENRLPAQVNEILGIDNILTSGTDPTTGKPLSQTQKTNLEALREKATAPSVGMMTNKESMEAAPKIAHAIEEGIGDLTMAGLTRQGKMEVEKILAEDKFDLQGARNDLLAIQTYIKTMNGQQMLGLVSSINFTKESLDTIDNPINPGDDMIGRLVKVLPQTKGKYPILNKAFLEAVASGVYGTKEDQATAGNLLSQINDLQGELAVVYMKGNAPTDKGLDLAKGMLQGEWSEDRLRGAIQLARKNLLLRQNSIRNAIPLELTTRGQQQFGPQYPGFAAQQQATQVNDRGLAKAPTPGQPISRALYKTYIKVYDNDKKKAMQAAQEAGWGPPEAESK